MRRFFGSRCWWLWLTVRVSADVWESGTVDERAVYLLCGNADFQVRLSSELERRPDPDRVPSQLAAHSLSIDRKIRVSLQPKTSIAMKVLRHRFNQLFNAKMRNPSITTESQQQWLDLVKEALVSKKSVVEEVEVKEVRPKVKISLQRNA